MRDALMNLLFLNSFDKIVNSQDVNTSNIQNLIIISIYLHQILLLQPMTKLVRLDLGGNLLQVNVSVCHLNHRHVIEP